jgi:hypothetical protein
MEGTQSKRRMGYSIACELSSYPNDIVEQRFERVISFFPKAHAPLGTSRYAAPRRYRPGRFLLSYCAGAAG